MCCGIDAFTVRRSVLGILALFVVLVGLCGFGNGLCGFGNGLCGFGNGLCGFGNGLCLLGSALRLDTREICLNGDRILVKHLSLRKNDLDKSALNKRVGILVGQVIIHVLGLGLNKPKLCHKHLDKLGRVLEFSVTLDLHKHRAVSLCYCKSVL